MNRTKALVLALFAVYWIIIVVILLAARDFYDGQLPQAVKSLATPRQAEEGTHNSSTRALSAHSSESGRKRLQPRLRCLLCLQLCWKLPANHRCNGQRSASGNSALSTASALSKPKIRKYLK